MKTRILSCLAIVVAISLGCGTFNNLTPDQKSSELYRVIYIAAEEGTDVALIQKPEWKPRFEDAQLKLHALMTSTNIPIEKVRAIVDGLPIKELKSKDAQIAISSARMVFDLAVGGRVNVMTNQIYIVTATSALYNGIHVAVARH